MWFGGMLSNIRYHQGRSGELVEQIQQLIVEPNSPDVWRAAAAHDLLESGRDDEARELALAEDFQGVSWDTFWLLAIFTWAHAPCSGATSRPSHTTQRRPRSRQLGAPVLLAHTRAGWARALTARGRPEDLERTQPMLEQADEVAGRLGAHAVTREVAECRAALAAISG